MRLTLIFSIFLFVCLNLEGYSQQKIKDFYLSNYKENGSQDWEVKGQEAVIYDTHVAIQKMEAKYYSKDDTVVIKSEKAKLNKENMNVYLKEKVKVKNKEGASLVTDYLNWKRTDNQVETSDWVKAENNSMQIKAKGLSADTQMKKVDFEENVEVQLSDKEGRAVKITCDGPLEIEYNEGVAVFNNNVTVDNKDGKLYADKTTVFFDNKEKKIVKIVSEGNVKIERENNVTFAQKATYFDADKKIILEGNPRLFYFPKDNENP